MPTITQLIRHLIDEVLEEERINVDYLVARAKKVKEFQPGVPTSVVPIEQEKAKILTDPFTPEETAELQKFGFRISTQGNYMHRALHNIKAEKGVKYSLVAAKAMDMYFYKINTMGRYKTNGVKRKEERKSFRSFPELVEGIRNLLGQ